MELIFIQCCFLPSIKSVFVTTGPFFTIPQSGSIRSFPSFKTAGEPSSTLSLATSSSTTKNSWVRFK
jgi:hypothetical protein